MIEDITYVASDHISPYSWWRHQMEIFSALLGFVRVIHRPPVTKASDAEFWCFLWSVSKKNGSVNNHEAGELICHRAHYDVTVMLQGH